MTCEKCGKETNSNYGTQMGMICKECASINNEDQEYGFNFGAGFLAPIWFITHGKAGIGVLLIIYSLFTRIFGVLGIEGYLLGNMITIGLIIYCGSIGNRIAMKNKGYSSIQETKEKENGWNIAGIIVGVIYVIMIFINLSSL